MRSSVDQRYARARRLGLAPAAARRLARLRTPEQIQDFVTVIPTNFEPEGDTALSVARVLKENRAHCVEAAFVAACALWLNGEKPLLLDFQARNGDDDHVVTLFRRGRCWGAISKSNHIWLRWRDPIYRSVRELAMSYFHEYVQGPRKTLFRYSRPFDLRRFAPAVWVTGAENCWDVTEALDLCRHYQLISPAQVRQLRPRDAMEIRGGKMLEYKAPTARKAPRY